jgi:hypothetical protein
MTDAIEKGMKISIHRNESSQPITLENVVNTYTKGGLFCILVEEDKKRVVYKYPLCSLFRITEEYSWLER